MREQPSTPNLIDDAQQLIQAAKNGHLQDIIAIQNRHTRDDFSKIITMQSSLDGPAMMVASANGNTEIVALLLDALQDANADTPAAINHEDRCSNTALMLASGNGYTAIASLLLNALRDAHDDIPAAINHENSYGNTALMWASENGHIKIVTLLLQSLQDAGANIPAAINHADNQGYTALMWASRNNETEIVDLLLQALQDVNDDIPAAINHADHLGHTALAITSRNGYTEIVEQLLKALHNAGADVKTATNHQDFEGNTALMLALNELDTINRGLTSNNTELTLTKYKNYTNTVKLLLSHGANLANTHLDTMTKLIADDNNRATFLCKLQLISSIHNTLMHLVAYGFSFLLIFNLLPRGRSRPPTPIAIDDRLIRLHTHIIDFTSVTVDTIARLIRRDRNLAGYQEKILSIIQNGDITWVDTDLADFSQKYAGDKSTLDQLISWAIIFGHKAFVEKVLPPLGTPNLETHTEYLRLALQAQKFEVAECLFKHLHGKCGQGNKQTVCNYLLHLMVIEHGPLPAIELLLQHGAVPKQYTQAHCEEPDRKLLEKHTLFQEHSPLNDIVKTNVDLRLRLRENNQTLFHAASAWGNHAVLKKIIEHSRPPTCSASPCT